MSVPSGEMPTADQLKLYAELMRSNAESELADSDGDANPDDITAARCEVFIAELFLKHYQQ